MNIVKCAKEVVINSLPESVIVLFSAMIDSMTFYAIVVSFCNCDRNLHVGFLQSSHVGILSKSESCMVSIL